jgi:hypothetical protein
MFANLHSIQQGFPCLRISDVWCCQKYENFLVMSPHFVILNIHISGRINYNHIFAKWIKCSLLFSESSLFSKVWFHLSFLISDPRNYVSSKCLLFFFFVVFFVSRTTNYILMLWRWCKNLSYFLKCLFFLLWNDVLLLSLAIQGNKVLLNH